jgi:5-methylcytosine-specific restriction enzyme subunit McrC
MVLEEWKTGSISGVELSFQDLKLAAQIGGEEGRVTVEEMKGGVRVKAYSWVGVIRFSQFEVHIIPKLAGEFLGLVRMLEIVSGIGSLRRNFGERNLLVNSKNNLFDLFALLLSEACETILQKGLLYDYIEVEDDLPFLRGRLLIKQQVRHRAGRVDRLECRYDEHSSNIIENQLLAAVLNICGRRVTDPIIRRQIRRQAAIFSSVCSLENFNLKNIRTSIVYDRMNENYEYAHSLAWIILDGSGVKDIFLTGKTKSFAFLLDMNQIFELFILRFFEFSFEKTDYIVKYQKQNPMVIWDYYQQRSYKKIIPDFIIENLNSGLSPMVIDAKYKLYDRKKVSSTDIYQSFLYAFVYGEDYHSTNALIVYPTNNQADDQKILQLKNLKGSVGANIRIFGFHIPSALKEMEANEKGVMSELLINSLTNVPHFN